MWRSKDTTTAGPDPGHGRLAAAAGSALVLRAMMVLAAAEVLFGATESWYVVAFY